MNQTTYYKNAPIKESDIVDISEETQIPVDVVNEVIAQFNEGGSEQVNVERYRGALKERVKKLVEYLSDSPESTGMELVRTPSDNAAYQLMSAMIDPGSSKFFIIDGLCSINPENPPTVEESYKAITEIMNLRSIGDSVNDKSSWLLGSAVDEFEKFHGNDFEVGQVVEEKSEHTVATSVAVYRAFKNKRYNVSFTHHKEVHYSKIPANSKHRILKKAEKVPINCKQIRDLCAIVKRLDDDSVIEDLATVQQVEDLLSAYKQAKTTYIIYNAGVWTYMKGLKTSIPTGAVVIDVGEMKVRKDNGEPIEIKKHQPLS